jgi:hypothetical protein
MACYTVPLRPLCDRERFGSDRQELRVAAVTHLFASCRPPHVTRLVVPIVVNSIEAVLGRWSSSYMLKERQEVFPPTLSNPDASSTPSRIVFVLLVLAASEHASPCHILRARCRVAARIFSVPDRNVFCFQAATRLRALSPQGASVDLDFFLAHTTCKPSPIPHVMQHAPCSDFAAGQIYESKPSPITLRHFSEA